MSKSQLWNRLSDENLHKLLRIAIEGPELEFSRGKKKIRMRDTKMGEGAGDFLVSKVSMKLWSESLNKVVEVLTYGQVQL